jgi:hypothetical protein
VSSVWTETWLFLSYEAHFLWECNISVSRVWSGT